MAEAFYHFEKMRIFTNTKIILTNEEKANAFR